MLQRCGCIPSSINCAYCFSCCFSILYLRAVTPCTNNFSHRWYVFICTVSFLLWYKSYVFTWVRSFSLTEHSWMEAQVSYHVMGPWEIHTLSSARSVENSHPCILITCTNAQRTLMGTKFEVESLGQQVCTPSPPLHWWHFSLEMYRRREERIGHSGLLSWVKFWRSYSQKTSHFLEWVGFLLTIIC